MAGQRAHDTAGSEGGIGVLREERRNLGRNPRGLSALCFVCVWRHTSIGLEHSDDAKHIDGLRGRTALGLKHA